MEKEKSPFLPDPLLGCLLGLCPAIAVSGNFATGSVIGLGLLLSMVSLGLLMPLVRRFSPERLWAPLAFALAASFSAFYSVLVGAYSPLLASLTGLFLPLIAVNCLVLSTLRKTIRRDEGLWTWLLPSALIYFVSLLLISAFREILGAGRLTLPMPAGFENTVGIFPEAPLRLLAAPAGGFILLGFLVLIGRVILDRKGKRIP
jgi:electron transport complex protein RnfE